MKKLIFISVIVLLNTLLFAQSPNAFKYQAVVRDASGASICNTDVSLKFIIHHGSPTGAEVYDETHSPTTTNDFGLVNLEIGNGTPVSGNFSAIEWESDIYFITVALDITGGSNYQEMGTEQLFSVPYAMHSINADKIAGNPVTGNPATDQILKWNGSEWQPQSDGLTLPFFGNCLAGVNNPALDIQQFGNGQLLLGIIYNSNSTSNIIDVTSNGSGGSGLRMDLTNSANNSTALRINHSGSGKGMCIEIDNGNNTSHGIEVDHGGGGWAGYFKGEEKGIYAESDGSGYAGEFEGDVHINGTLTGSNKQFVIDHPSDPYNKILRHNCIESPEMMNIYKGRAKLVNGEVVIELPNYFDALNHPENREINLTSVNGWSPLYLDGEIANNQFFVKTTEQGNPNQEFSWVVYAVRNDKWAQDNPLVVEEEKGVNNRFVKGELT
ncbi:MAG: hypothetical protein K8S16_16885 [Bacteroidales bacterium]|nr:hypothetical protein [Bacteroidales bacterium]